MPWCEFFNEIFAISETSDSNKATRISSELHSEKLHLLHLSFKFTENTSNFFCKILNIFYQSIQTKKSVHETRGLTEIIDCFYIKKQLLLKAVLIKIKGMMKFKKI